MLSQLIPLLAIDDVADRWSAAGQLGSMALAAGIGRFVFRTRTAIWLISFIGAFGAMMAQIMVDGQGAVFLLVYAPIIYLLAVAGRHNI